MTEHELQEEIEQLSECKNLTVLHLGANRLTSLPAKICTLSKLTTIHLGGNRLRSLPADIRWLTGLIMLDLGVNQLNCLPAELGELNKLAELDLRNNLLRSLPVEIGQLENLTELDLRNNLLRSLPEEIGQLKNLTELDLRNNQLRSLPEEIGQLKNLTKLNMRVNPLPVLPEILAKTDSPEEILRYYFQITTAPTRPLNEAKLLVVGEANVGKTSLIRRLLGHPFGPLENLTEGIERQQWTVVSGDDAIRLNIWDFGGQEVMHATHQFFLTRRSLYLLVIDSRQSERQSRIDYWMRIIESFGEDSPAYFRSLQRKLDLSVVLVHHTRKNAAGGVAAGCGVVSTRYLPRRSA